MAFLCSFGLCSSSSSSSSYHRLRSDTSSSPPPPPTSIPIVLDGADQIFFVDPSILDHWIFQDLLDLYKKGPHVHRHHPRRRHYHLLHHHRHNHERRHQQNENQNQLHQNQKKAIVLNCDAILFEFLIWLVENDDPSIRELDVNDLIEFYGGSDQS